MKPFPVVSRLSAWAFVLSMSLMHVAGAGAVSLRYQPLDPGVTNIYEVTVETRGEAGREMLTGNLFITANAPSGNLIAIASRGQLRFKPVPGQISMGGFRPNGPVPLNSLVMGAVAESREIWMDAQGRIVRSAQDMNLPIPLGQLLASFIEEFPAKAANDWDSEKDVCVLDDPMMLGPIIASTSSGYAGPMYYNPGRTPQAALVLREKSTSKVLETTPETVVLQRELAWNSYVLTGAEPRIRAVLKVKTERFRNNGLPRTLEAQGNSVVVTEHLSRRMELSLRWRLLEGTERETVLNPPPPPPTKPFTAEELAKITNDLAASDIFIRQNALMALNSGRLVNPPGDLLKQVAAMVQDSEENIREHALSLLATHAGKNYAPILIQALRMPVSGSVRNKIAEALGKIKDPNAVLPLTELLAQGSPDQLNFMGGRDNPITQALIGFGAEAEPSVLEVLKQPHLATRLQACGILKRIGTRKSLEALQDLTSHPVKEVSEAAAEASRWISSREQGK